VHASDLERPAPILPRARGEIRADFFAHGARTRVRRLYETGGPRLRFPKAREICDGVIVNTAGGVVGGDEARLSFAAGAGARIALTTQSAEKIYRADGPPARIETMLKLEAGAALDWLPQETILFDRANLVRSLDVDMAADARLIACESVVFGRQAMGETCTSGAFRDRWRVRRAGKLIFAEDTRLESPAALLARPAIGAGAGDAPACRARRRRAARRLSRGARERRLRFRHQRARRLPRRAPGFALARKSAAGYSQAVFASPRPRRAARLAMKTNRTLRSVFDEPDAA
jgi:urease accessory protein